jgi:hypothetical protein
MIKRRPFIATVYTNERRPTPIVLGSFRRAHTAITRAERWLDRHPRDVTRQGGGDRYGAFAIVTDARRPFEVPSEYGPRPGNVVATREAPHRLCLSVADVGFW